MRKIDSKSRWIIIVLSILHLLCDLICGYKVVGILSKEYYDYGLYLFILYNTIAFCFQPFIGLFIDKYKIEKITLLFSFVFLLLGIILPTWWLSAIFLGLGNQVFHVTGGKICTNISSQKASHLGVFVSLGAIGLAIGSYLYQYVCLIYISVGLSFLLTILCYGLVITSPNREEKKENEKNILNIQDKKYKIWGLTLMCLAVFIRSFLGKIVHSDFEMTFILLLVFPLMATLGKAMGGFIRDRIGSLPTIVISMILSTTFFLFLDFSIIGISIGILLMNMSMPITLYELNQLFPNHEGFNFGLLAAILFPGVVVGMLYPYHRLSYSILLVLSCFLTIISIDYVQKKRVQNG